MTLLKDFINGCFFWAKLLIILDRFLLKTVILMTIPFWCILEDILGFIRQAFCRFLYNRSLFILSNKKYAKSYFVNRFTLFFDAFFRKNENLYIFSLETFLPQSFLQKKKNLYNYLNNYEETIIPVFSFILPLFILRILFIPFYNKFPLVDYS